MAGKTKRSRKQGSQEEQLVAGMLEDISGRYPHVIRVTDLSTNGKAARVDIECTAKFDGCEGERNIAVQDAFQVRRCRSCQREALKARRRKGPAKAAKPKAKRSRKAAAPKAKRSRKAS